ncbi:MAG: molybdopterin-guanine dinucleotide biosynthesis protein B [Deltaproteobacteria bacterium]|nr:molybdopterin-guanine dinucleotide biosynthesis protein B [Deltaproteobacteria bacterium]
MTVPVVSIVGTSGSGKTTLVTMIITELCRRGHRVVVIKHDAHGFSIDHKGKDSWRHKQAGASSVAISSPAKFAIIKDVEHEWPPERIIQTFFQDADIVITEGYKRGAFHKIEVVRAAHSKESVCAGDPLLLGYATNVKIKTDLPLFKLNDFKGLSDFIEKKVIATHPLQKVSLIVNGSPVTLKPFIANLLKDGISGMIKSLKGCSKADEIEVRIRR